MNQKRETKTAQVNLKILPSLKAMADKMAADDNRSLTSLVESLIVNALKERGYLPGRIVTAKVVEPTE